MNGEPVFYVDGACVPRAAAVVPVEDRGLLFGDGVYEVVGYFGGRSFAMQAHLARLRRSLAAIDIALTDEIERIEAISDEVAARNGYADAKVYWQVTRGGGRPRDHLPGEGMRARVFVLAYPVEPLNLQAEVPVKRAVTGPDVRWGRCDIKSIMLLANTMAKSAAAAAGADEVIFVRDGIVTEGGATNVFVVEGGRLRTHPADCYILPGVTRAQVIEAAAAMGIEVVEKAFDVAALKAADEVFITGTMTHVAAITQVDGQSIGDGRAGAVTGRMHRAMMAMIREACS